jgi:radical SAM superfamily enzyme YgiQ (UPF0313 family)
MAGTLRDNDIDVHIVDGCILGWSGVREELRSYMPDMVGITCLTPMRKKALAVASMVKEINKNATVVLGGAHPTIMYQQLLSNYNDVDIVVRGEGELCLLEIAKGIDLNKINGLAYRDGVKIIKTAHRKHVEDLDKLSFPAWDLIAETLPKYPATAPVKSFRGIDLFDGPRVSAIYSRGCLGKCDFCSSWWIWKGWRHRSAKNMVDELEWLYESLNIRHFWFADDALTVDKQATLDLCDEIIERNLHIAFFATTRSDCVDLEILEKLSEAGCYEISYGIETASPELLSRMKKENNVQTSEKAIALTKRAGIRVCALLIVGGIGETEETIDETIEFLQKTDPEGMGTVGGLWILPGTGLYRYGKKLGIIDDSYWLSDTPYMIFTQEHSLRRLRFFAHAVKERKKLSEMTVKYRISYALLTCKAELIREIIDVLNKYPVIKSVLKSFYLAVTGNVNRIIRFGNRES